MMESMYPAHLEVRPDIDAAHLRVCAHVTATGEWWTAAERAAAANVVRDAFYDPTPVPPWMSAWADRARWSTSEPVIDVALVDALYRMTAHAHTITEPWYRNLIANGVEEQAYVELCEILVSVTAMCSFARTVGAPKPEIPAPSDTAVPRRESVVAEVSPRNWVPVAPPGGSRASVIEALSTSSIGYDLLWNHLAPAQYMSNMQMSDLTWSRGTLSRPQAELVAGRVASLRQCFF